MLDPTEFNPHPEDRGMDWKELPVTHRAVIPETYLDEMGHMNVMWYTHLFSQAADGLFTLFGMTLAYFEANQAGSFALEQHVRYFNEVRAGQHVTVRSRLLGRSDRLFHFMHFLSIDESDQLAATGEYIGAHVDMRIRRTSAIPRPIAELFDRLLAEHQQLAWAAPTCGAMKLRSGS